MFFFEYSKNLEIFSLKAAPVTFLQIKIKHFDLRPSFEFS